MCQWGTTEMKVNFHVLLIISVWFSYNASTRIMYVTPKFVKFMKYHVVKLVVMKLKFECERKYVSHASSFEFSFHIIIK